MSYDAVGFNPGRSVLAALPAGSPSRGKAQGAMSQLKLETAKANQQAAVTDMKNEAAQRQAHAGNRAKQQQNAVQIEGKKASNAMAGEKGRADVKNSWAAHHQGKKNQKMGQVLDGLIKS